MPKYNIGDQVKLKSGGPKMTVDGYHPNYTTRTHCVWFVGGKNNDAYFDEATLVPATEDAVSNGKGTVKAVQEESE